MELQQEEIKLFSKIDLVRTQSQLSDERHMDQAEELHKWKTQHEVQIKEVKKLLSGLLHQRKTEGEPNYKGRLAISNRLTFFHFHYLILHANCNRIVRSSWREFHETFDLYRGRDKPRF